MSARPPVLEDRVDELAAQLAALRDGTLLPVSDKVDELSALVAELRDTPQDSVGVINPLYINTIGSVNNTETPAPLGMAGFFAAEKTELQAFVAPGAKAAEVFPFSAIVSDFLNRPGEPKPGNVKIAATERPLAGEFTVDASGGGFFIAGNETGGSAPWEPEKEQHADFYLIKGAPGSKITLAPQTMDQKAWNTLVGQAGFKFELWDPVKNEHLEGGAFSGLRQTTLTAIPAGGEVVLIIFPPEKWEGKPWPGALQKPYTAMVMLAPNATFTKILLPSGFLYLIECVMTISLAAATNASGALVAKIPLVEQLPGGTAAGEQITLEDREVYSVTRAAAEASKVKVAVRPTVFIPEQHNLPGRYLEIAVQAEPGLPGNATTYAWETMFINITQLTTTPNAIA